MLLLNQLPDAILLVDRHSVIRQANDQASRLFGHPEAALVGHAVEMLVPAELRRRHVDHRRGYTAEPRTRPMGGKTGTGTPELRGVPPTARSSRSTSC